MLNLSLSHSQEAEASGRGRTRRGCLFEICIGILPKKNQKEKNTKRSPSVSQKKKSRLSVQSERLLFSFSLPFFFKLSSRYFLPM